MKKLNTDAIQRMTSSMVAKLDMKYVDAGDFWDVWEEAKKSVEEHSDFILPEQVNLATYLTGIVVGQAMYETTVVPLLNDGQHSDQILVGVKEDA